MKMQTRFVLRNASLAAALAITALSSAQAAAAASKSDVSLETAVTTNAAVLGSTATQSQEVGNSSGGGQAEGEGKTIVTTNAAVLGSSAKQTQKIGNAVGANSKSSVKLRTPSCRRMRRCWARLPRRTSRSAMRQAVARQR